MSGETLFSLWPGMSAAEARAQGYWVPDYVPGYAELVLQWTNSEAGAAKVVNVDDKRNRVLRNVTMSVVPLWRWAV
jgi:hypothetical protein